MLITESGFFNSISKDLKMELNIVPMREFNN